MRFYPDDLDLSGEMSVTVFLTNASLGGINASVFSLLGVGSLCTQLYQKVFEDPAGLCHSLCGILER